MSFKIISMANTNALLEKKVFSKPQHILIKEDIDLLSELKREVNATLEHLPRSRTIWLKVKLFLLPTLYLGFYAMSFPFANRPLIYLVIYSLMGIMVVLIFINLIHELCHGNVFKTAKYNSWGYMLFDILGANSFIWQQRHLNLHHRYPNTRAWDSDVEQKGPVLIFPNEPRQKHHRYQHIYMLLLYPLFILNWLLVRDFKDFFRQKKYRKKNNGHTQKRIR